MKALEIENKLREVVSRLICEVELSTKQERQDINLVSEDAWIPILKEVFQCHNLINLNKKKKNFPGIDLGDERDRVAFQVTSTTDMTKVKKTLNQFKDRGYKNTFDELYMFTLINKQKSYSQQAIDDVTEGEFEFNAKEHIVDPGDILNKIKPLRVGVQKRLLKEFEIILGDIEDKREHSEDIDPAPIFLTSNLVRVTFPEELYIAELNLNKKAILDSAREQLDFKKKRVSPQLLLTLFLKMQGIENHNWVYHENKIFTFHNIENESDFKDVIDIGTVERIESADLFDSEHLDYRNLFKQILKNCIRDMLSDKSVIWSKQQREFYFMPNEEGQEKRRESWKGKKIAKRIVYQLHYQKKDPTKLAHHRHLSFDVSFIQVDSLWYCVINPNWLFTWNLYKKNKFHDNLLSQKKRLEHNHSVRDSVRFITYFLNKTNGLGDYFVKFHELAEFQYQASSQIPDDIEPEIETGEIN